MNLGSYGFSPDLGQRTLAPGGEVHHTGIRSGTWQAFALHYITFQYIALHYIVAPLAASTAASLRPKTRASAMFWMQFLVIVGKE